MSVPSSAARRWVSVGLLVISGFAGLGYQVAWTQQSALWLGHESAAVLAIVAAFFGGQALGALLLGARVERSLHPARWYAGCELLIALWAVVLARLMPPLSVQLLRLTGVEPSALRHWLVAFVGGLAMLLPSTVAMGATLPALQRLESQVNADGRSVALLYAANTFGALLGALLVALWLIPALGLTRSLLTCAGLSLLCGVVALVALRERDAPVPAMRERLPVSGLTLRLAATGLLGIGYEVLVVRVLSQVSEDTVFTFALLLAVYLVGSAVGAALYQRWLPNLNDAERLTDNLLGALAGCCVVGGASLWAAERSRDAAQAVLAAGAQGAMVSEAVPAVLAFALPTLAMGAVFSHLGRLAQVGGIGFGRALGVNTIGAAIAPVVFGVLLAPALGPKLTLLVIVGGYLALVSRAAWRLPSTWGPAAAALTLWWLAPPLAFVEIPEGGRLVSYEDGVVAAVSVVEDADGVRRLRIDNRAQEGSSASQRVDGRQAWLPLLLHPAPRSALFLGLGTGVTAASAAEDATLQVDAVELLPEVISASVHFASSVANGAGRARLHVLPADARRYVRASERTYDVIVSDNFHPARSGSGSLYTVEHFEAVRQRLAPSGLFCQWLPLHQLDRATTRSIVKAFLAAFPKASAIIASNSLETPVLGLVGRRDGNRFDVAAARARFASVTLPERMASMGLEDELAVLGSFIAGPGALRRFAGDAPLNTDDTPVVTYLAPRVTYAPDSRPAVRFIALLHELSLEPSELVAASTDVAWSRRLRAYWQARNHFIESGRGVRPSPHVQEVLAQVQGPLLAVLRESPDFRPAYDPLLNMAMALAQADASAARALLTELTRLQPARPEATQALAVLGGSAPTAP